MFHRMTGFSEAEINKIHDAVLEVLRDVGVAFREPEAVEVFKNHGFKTEGETVFFQEKQVVKALATAPSRFVVDARNPEKDVAIGGKDFVLLPGWGSPFIIDGDGNQREALMADYIDFCKLVHTSPYLDMMDFLAVMPSDIPPFHSHLDMMLANLLYTDKACMATPQDRRKAKDNIDMLSILWGGRDKIQDRPVTISKINPVSPLLYTEEMTGALIEYAQLGQPLQFPNLCMAGTTGPVSLPGTLVVLTAEALAGIVLAQIIRPGTPCVFGGNSCSADMKTGSAAAGGPEAIVLIHAITQMAKFYGLPCKAGGSVTDAHVPDMQAGFESGLSLFTALAAGAHMMDQSCGILSCFNAMSFEKFLVDEENCGYVRRILRPMEVSDNTIGMDQIKRAGIGGSYLAFPETFSRFRKEIFIPNLASRSGYDHWASSGKKEIRQKAAEYKEKRLAAYEKPVMDPGLEEALIRFVKRRKTEIIAA